MHKPPATLNDYSAYFEEGVEGINITYRERDRVVTYINGLPHAYRPGYRYYAETIVALSSTSKPVEALIIGFGTGSTTEMVLKAPTIERVTVVELNSTLIKNLLKIDIFNEIFDNPNLKLITDDGRRFLLREQQKFDFIAMDPLRTTTAYSNNIYSQEFFELISQHMSSKGVFLIWMDEHHVLPKTVSSVFPYVQFYKYFALASNQSFVQSEDAKYALLQSFDQKAQQLIEKQWEIESYVDDKNYIKDNLNLYPINKDWKPVTEYYFGLKFKKRLLYD